MCLLKFFFSTLFFLLSAVVWRIKHNILTFYIPFFLFFYRSTKFYYFQYWFVMVSKMNTQLKISTRRARMVNGLNDPTTPFTQLMKFNDNDLDLKMHFIKSSAMTSSIQDEICSLMRDNMMEIYKKCPWGWNEKKKSAELFHKNARYLIFK